MKKLLVSLLAGLVLVAFARAEEDTLGWYYSAPLTNIVFKLYLSTNAVPTPPLSSFIPVASTTNLILTYTNPFSGICTFFVTASNTLRQAESPPSNMLQLPGFPIAPDTFRLISITVRPPP
jgi:hypothetical protein